MKHNIMYIQRYRKKYILHMLKLKVNLNFFVKIVTGFNTTGVFMTGKNMTYFSKTVKLSPS